MQAARPQGEPPQQAGARREDRCEGEWPAHRRGYPPPRGQRFNWRRAPKCGGSAGRHRGSTISPASAREDPGRRGSAHRASLRRAASRGCRRPRAPGGPSRGTRGKGSAESSTSPEVGQLNADHTRASASGCSGVLNTPSRTDAPSTVSSPSRLHRPPRGSRTSPPGRKRSSPIEGRAITPSAGAPWASCSSHITSSTPSSASARRTTSERNASACWSAST